MKTTKMKWLILSVVLAVSSAARAESVSSVVASSAAAPSAIHQLVLQDFAATAIDLIKWKVGDSTTYDIELGQFGELGTMLKAAFKEEGKAIWVRNSADLGAQKDVTEILVNRADGKILKMIRNGKEEEVPNDEIEIISQEYTEITVPAGTFECLHVVAKSKQTEKMEIWANPQAVSLDGTLQMSIETQFGEMILKLTQYKRI